MRVLTTTLTTRINAARRAVGDDGQTQAVIKTFPRRGFRFVADLLNNVGDDEHNDSSDQVLITSYYIENILNIIFINLCFLCVLRFD